MATNLSGPVRCVRAEPRMQLGLSAELRTETVRTPARLMNLSRGGACVELDHPVVPGREVTLHSGALTTVGHVVWRDGHRCGVRFAHPIRATELLVQMSQSRKAQLSGGETPRFPSS